VITDSSSSITALLADRRLLDHPFYTRWERGEVSMAELGSYAAQYRHFEGFLPQFLARLLADLPDGAARHLIARNLADELGDPVAHIELFEQFAQAVGAGDDAPSPATAELLATYDNLLDSGPTDGLAGFVAYESQASEVACRKAEGLRRHHGLDERAVSFWAHHAVVDVDHGTWAQAALDDLTGTVALPAHAIRLAADAWLRFLDEREGAA
jgi:pyrroloquinoline-quinone synthase